MLNWHEKFDFDKFDSYVQMRDDLNKVKAMKELQQILGRMVKGDLCFLTLTPNTYP